MHHRVNPHPDARRQNETEMFSDHDGTSPSIAAVSAKIETIKPSIDFIRYAPFSYFSQHHKFSVTSWPSLNSPTFPDFPSFVFCHQQVKILKVVEFAVGHKSYHGTKLAESITRIQISKHYCARRQCYLVYKGQATHPITEVPASVGHR